MNMIKKYRLKGLKALGIKKSWGFLGDVWGCVNSALTRNDKGNAADSALLVCFTLRELAEHMTELRECHGTEDAFNILLGEITADQRKFYVLANRIQAHNGNIMKVK